MTDGSPTGAPLAIPGLVYVAPTDALHPATVEMDAASGWRAPRGIRQWSHEASVTRASDLKAAVRGELGIALPHERIDQTKHPLAYRAAKANPVVAVPNELVATLVGKGVRVYTIGYDKVTSGFFYIAEGGGEPVRVQGDLIAMLAPILQYGSENEDIERHMGRVVDRLLTSLSDGAVTEARVELADSLPSLAKKGEAVSTDVEAFEREAKTLADASHKWESRARDLVATLEGSTTRKETTVEIPLYGEARRVTRTEMELDVGDKRIVLPARVEWVVSGEISEAPRKVVAAAPIATAEVDDAWGADADASEAPTAKPGGVAPVARAKAATPSPAAAKVTPSPSGVRATPSPVAAKATPSPAAAKATPSPAVPRATPSPAAAKATPTPSPRTGTVLGMPVKPSPASGTASSSGPMLEVVGGEPSEPGFRPSLEPAIEKPVSPAVVASRIAVVVGSGDAPVPVQEKKKPVVEAKPAATIEVGDAEEEEEEEEDDRRHLTADEKASRRAAKAAKKAERQAARRAAAEAANKAANAPKPKEKRETKTEPSERVKSERAAAKSASKSTRPAAKEKAAPPAAESTGSSFGTIFIVILIMLAAAAAIWWFVLRKH